MNPRVVALLVVSGTIAASAHAEGPVNLLSNGGFEEGISGWQVSVADPGKRGAAVTVDAGQARQGEKSLCLTLPGIGQASAGSPLAPVRPGEDYLFTFWYRSDGFSESGLYAGVNVQYVVHWLDADRKPLGTDGSGLAYGAVPEWRFMVRMFRPPPGTAFVSVTFPMSVVEGGRPSRFRLDDARWRAWPSVPGQGGKSWVFHVADGTFQQDLFRRAADDDTESGFAVVANPRFGRTPGYLAGNLYTRELPPGQYRAVFRLKVAEVPRTPEKLLSWDVNTDHLGALAAGTIGADAFAAPGVYQDVSVRFVVPPGVAWVDPRLTWHGGPATWIDTITLVAEKAFTADDIKALLD